MIADYSLMGSAVHTKPDGVPLRLFLRAVSMAVWYRGIPKFWRSIEEG